MTGWDARRIAEVIADFPGGARKRGSGYRVSSSYVLTSAHVVEGATQVVVRFEAGTTAASPNEWSTECAPPTSLGFDIAALELLETPTTEPIYPPEYGRMESRLSYPSAIAVGFPVSRARSAQVQGKAATYRDSVQAVGNLTPLSQLKAGNMELSVMNHPGSITTSPSASAWAGMSGAAVWVAERLVGIVTEDTDPASGNTLTVSPLSSLTAADGCDPDDKFLNILGAPWSEPWVDVSLADELQSVLADHHRQLQDLVPDSGLQDRDAELSAMMRFCLEYESGYWEWRADPWAGKTGLMATFASTVPTDLRVVSFFIDGQRVGRRDVASFRQAVCLQLDAVAGKVSPTPLTPGAEDQTFKRCLDAAVTACKAQGARLVLVVDALDEDAWKDDSESLGTSIASLLPIEPSAGLYIVVASRYNPEYPSDLPERHPLRVGHSRHNLTSSPHAAEVQRRASHEVRRILAREAPDRQAIILIAVAGSLSVDDIIDITGLNRVKLENTLRNCRIIRAADRHFPGRPTDSAFAFSHKTLPELTRSHLSRHEILQATEAILEAGMRHARNAWSDETPTFFLWSSYPAFLAGLNDLNALIICVTDTARHKQLMRYPGGYSQIREELDTSEVALSKRTPNLELYLRITIAKTATRLASKNVPTIIPELYSRMGEHQSALSLIAGMPFSSKKEDLTLKIVLAQIKSNHIALAIDTVSMISNAAKRARGLAALAEVQYIHGQDNAETLREAFKLAMSVKNSLDTSVALRRVISAYSKRGEVPSTVLDAALNAACNSGPHGIQELLELAKLYSEFRISPAEPLRQAYAIGLSIKDPFTRFDALCDIARAYAHSAGNIPPIFAKLVSSALSSVPSRELLSRILGLAEALAAHGLNVRQLMDCGRVIARSNIDAKLRLHSELDILEAESVCLGQTTVDLSVVNGIAQKSEDPALIMRTLSVLARLDFDINPFLPALPLLITREMTSELRCALWVQLIKLAGPKHYLSKQALEHLSLLMRFGVSSASLVEIARIQYGCGEDPEISLRMAENQAYRSYSMNTTKNLLAIGSICAEFGVDSRSPMLRAWQDAKRWGFWNGELLLVARSFAAAKMDAEAVLKDAAEIARDNAESLARIASCQLDLALDPTQTLQRALKVARPQGFHSDDSTLYRLVCLETEVSRTSEAVDIAARISDPALQILALKVILGATNQPQEDSQVLVEQLRIGSGVRSLTQRATFMSNVASTLADSQMDASWALSEALFAAHTSPYDARPECLIAVATAQLHCGKDPARALANARRLVADPRSGNRALRLVEISRVELLAGLDSAATLHEAYATAIGDSVAPSVELLISLCTAMVAAGMSSTDQFSKAKARILELGGSPGQAKCLIKVYSEHVRRGLTEQSPFHGRQNLVEVQARQEAMDAIVAVEDRLERISLLLELSVAVREADQDAEMILKEARAVVSEVVSAESRFNALLLIAEQEIAAGMDPDWTLTRARSEVGAHANLMKIAQLRARTGRLEEAMQAAGAVSDKTLCVKVWSEVAKVASASQASIANEALTLALSEGSWVPVLEPLCRWEPSALEIIESSLMSTDAGE